MSSTFNIVTFGEPGQDRRRDQLAGLLRGSPLPDEELMLNLGLFLTPQALGRILFMHHLYRQILEVQGVVVEFGCRWGQNLSLFTSLRGIYEPYNRLRKVVGFDTFAGFPGVSPEDGRGRMMAGGNYAVTPKYTQYLERVLTLQEQESPLPHIRKHEIIPGDACSELAVYLERHPETVIALAYFDFDLYEPTRQCLELIRSRLTRGSVIGFDELNDPECPGETRAVQEVLGLSRFPLRRFPASARTSYLVVDGPIDR